MLDITRQEIEKKNIFDFFSSESLLIIIMSYVILFILITIGIYFVIHTSYSNFYQSLVISLFSSLISIMIIICFMSLIDHLAIKNYREDYDEIKINGKAKIENVQAHDDQSNIATYYYNNKVYSIIFDNDHELKKNDVVTFNNYKEEIDKKSKTIHVNSKDFDQGKIKFKTN